MTQFRDPAWPQGMPMPLWKALLGGAIGAAWAFFMLTLLFLLDA